MIDAARWTQLSPLVDRALDLTDEARESWLVELATTDPDSARDVRELLSNDSARGGTGTLTRALNALTPQPAETEGTRIGDWTLLRTLGEGGMGSVWLADRSDGTFDGTAAVKLLNLRGLGGAGLARFRQEGTALARLTHPGIARLFDAGVRENGQPYLILEYIDGIRIDEWCDEQRLTVPQRIALFLTTCDAVAHAHAHFVIHRDIKPSNILVTTDGTVKLLDFGVARLAQQDGTDADSTPLPFTPAYAAPEQLAAKPESAATDVYSLGVLLYSMLTGKMPARPPVAASSAAAWILSADAAARRSSSSALPKMLRGDLDAILARALEQDPSHRYQTVTAFADDLRRTTRHEGVSVRQGTTTERVARFVRRNSVAVFTGGTIALALLTATGVSWRQTRVAEAARDKASRALQLARATGDMQVAMMSMVGPGGRALTPSELLGMARKSVETQHQNDPAILSALLGFLAERYADLNDLGNQGAVLAAAAQAAHQANDTPSEATNLCLAAWVMLQAGQTDSAAVRLREGMALLPKVRPDTSGAIIACNSARSRQFTAAGKFDSAIVVTKQSVTLLEAEGDTLTSNYTVALNNLGLSQGMSGKTRDASGTFGRLKMLLQRGGRADTDGMLTIAGNHISQLVELGEFVAARDMLEREIAQIGPIENGSAIPLVLRYRGMQVYSRLRQADSVVAQARRLIADREAQNPRVQLEAYALLVNALLQLSNGPEAGRMYQAMQPMLVKAPPIPSMRVAAISAGAAIAAHGGKVVEALDTLNTFVRAFSKREGGGDQSLLGAYLRASALALQAGNPAEALAQARLAKRAAAIDSLTMTRSASYGDALIAESRALAAGHDPAAAAAAQQALVPLRFGYGTRHPHLLQIERWIADTLGAAGAGGTK